MEHSLYTRLCDRISALLPAINALLPEDQRWRSGVWFVLYEDRGKNGSDWHIVAATQLGRTIRNKQHAAQFGAWAIEKAERLISNPDHRTSRESRQEAEGKFGGAIRTGHYILSCSGLLEDWNEAAALCAAFQENLITMDEIKQITNLVVHVFFHTLVTQAFEPLPKI